MTAIRYRLTNVAWYLGVHAFRLTRRANLSTRFEPAFTKIAGLLPRTSSEIVAKLPGGAYLTMPPGYRDTRTVVTGLFQADETRLFQALAKPGMTVVDVGAYVGYFTILAASLVGPTGRVLAFEPEPMAYKYLVRNVEGNQYRNVVTVNAGLTDTSGHASLKRDPNGPESFISNAPEDSASIRVEMTTLDSVLGSDGWPSIDLIKMNIEGHEVHALRGARETSSRNPALQLVMEFNPPAMARSAITNEALTNVLRELGFRQSQIVERGLEVVRDAALLPRGDVVYNLLLTK